MPSNTCIEHVSNSSELFFKAIRFNLPKLIKKFFDKFPNESNYFER